MMPARSVPAAATVIRFDEGSPEILLRPAAAEVAVNIVYANLPFAVMMMTPRDLEDFAVGFSITEGIVAEPDEIRGVRVEPEEKGLRLVVDLVPKRLAEHLARRRGAQRGISGRTGCGLCGIEDLAALPFAAPVGGLAPCIDVGAVRRALRELEENQLLNFETGAVHGAGFATLEGELLALREDVGRHNALDKLIGALRRDAIAPDTGFVVVTSRCSFEMVEKVAAFGCRSLVAISAPTSLALERARAHDMMLIALARRDAMTVFHGLDRISREHALA